MWPRSLDEQPKVQAAEAPLLNEIPQDRTSTIVEEKKETDKKTRKRRSRKRKGRRQNKLEADIRTITKPSCSEKEEDEDDEEVDEEEEEGEGEEDEEEAEESEDNKFLVHAETNIAPNGPPCDAQSIPSSFSAHDRVKGRGTGEPMYTITLVCMPSCEFFACECINMFSFSTL